MSDLWTAVDKQLGTQYHRITLYHPQANNLVECFYCHLSLMLCARLQGPNRVDKLLRVLLGIQTVPKGDLDDSSVEFVHGFPLTVP